MADWDNVPLLSPAVADYGPLFPIDAAPPEDDRAHAIPTAMKSAPSAPPCMVPPSTPPPSWWGKGCMAHKPVKEEKPAVKEETGSSGGGPLQDVTATPHVGRVRVAMPPAAMRMRSHDYRIRASQLPAPSAPPCAWPAAHACRAIPPPPVWNAPPGNWHPRPRADATHPAGHNQAQVQELKTQLQKAKRMKELQLQKANRMKELQLQEMASMEAQLQEAQHACLASRDAEQDRERKDKLLLEMLMEDKERQLRNCVLQPKQPCKPPPFHLLHAKSSRCISVNTDEEEEAALSSKPPSPWPRFYATKGAAISTAVRRKLTDHELQEAFSMEGRKRRHEMEANGTALKARNECGHKTRGRSWAQREASTLRQAEMNDAGSEPEITRDMDFQ